MSIKHSFERNGYESLKNEPRVVACTIQTCKRSYNMGMIGAILGDIAGQAFEFQPVIDDWQKEAYDLWNDWHVKGNHITDDSVMTIACGMAIASGSYHFAKWYRELGNRYIDIGYGPSFREWLQSDKPKPYESYGNGSAMRASACGQFAKSLQHAERLGRMSAMCTHNHPEGIRGAETEAGLTWLARREKDKEKLIAYFLSKYPVEQSAISALVPTKEYEDEITFDATCQGTLPIAFRCFYETNSFTEMMLRINSMRIDTDTAGAIAGSWAQEFYGFCTESKEDDIKKLEQYLPEDLWAYFNKACKYGQVGAERARYMFWR